MKKICKKCKNEIPDMDLTEEAKLKLYGLIYQELKLFAVKMLTDEYELGHKEAKIIVTHMNRHYGKCTRCDFNELNSECVECPKCGAFNYNLKLPIFNEEFCANLEHALPFNRLADEDLHGFWCDGIDPIPYDIENLALDALKRNRKIKTRAWTGRSGQEIFEMTIHFGEKSIACFEKDLSLEDCIYSGNPDDWISVEPNQKKIAVKLK